MAEEKEDKEKDTKKEEPKKGEKEKDAKDEAPAAPTEVDPIEDLGKKLDIPQVEVMSFDEFVVATYGQEEADKLGLKPEETEENPTDNLEDLPADTGDTVQTGDETTPPADETTPPADENPEASTEEAPAPPAI